MGAERSQQLVRQLEGIIGRVQWQLHCGGSRGGIVVHHRSARDGLCTCALKGAVAHHRGHHWGALSDTVPPGPTGPPPQRASQPTTGTVRAGSCVAGWQRRSRWRATSHLQLPPAALGAPGGGGPGAGQFPPRAHGTTPRARVATRVTRGRARHPPGARGHRGAWALGDVDRRGSLLRWLLRAPPAWLGKCVMIAVAAALGALLLAAVASAGPCPSQPTFRRGAIGPDLAGAACALLALPQYGAGACPGPTCEAYEGYWSVEAVMKEHFPNCTRADWPDAWQPAAPVVKLSSGCTVAEWQRTANGIYCPDPNARPLPCPGAFAPKLR